MASPPATRPLKVLMVEDNPQHAELARIELATDGIDCDHAETAELGLEYLRRNDVDVVISDYHLPGMDGMQFLAEVRALRPQLPVVMVTGMGNERTAVAAMKAGASDYVIKEARLGYLQILPTVIRKAYEKSHLSVEVERLRQEVRSRGRFSNIIGNSQAMRDVFRLLEAIVPSTATVLVNGESGTGKELIARAIHYNGPKANGPFVPCNCGAIPATLVESELFGHEKGAFTGATSRRVGHFEAAHGGTLFLDEISELPAAAQVTLLRAVQERQITRVGGSTPFSVDVRIIAACNKNLLELSQRGQFREDLYYRLNVLSVELPPLRDRGDDVLLLAQHYLDQYAKENGKPMPALSAAATGRLRQYPWPGNVRELQHAIQRAVILARGAEIQAADLPGGIAGEREQAAAVAAGPRKSYNLAENERRLVAEVLDKTAWNITQAAKMLGTTRSTLYSKIERHGLQPPVGFKPIV